MDALLLSHLDNVRSSNNAPEKKKVRESREISYSRIARSDLAKKDANIEQIQAALTITQPKKKSRKVLKKLIKAQQQDSKSKIRSVAEKAKSRKKSST